MFLCFEEQKEHFDTRMNFLQILSNLVNPEKTPKDRQIEKITLENDLSPSFKYINILNFLSEFNTAARNKEK